jgi:hypothetical protein
MGDSLMGDQSIPDAALDTHIGVQKRRGNLGICAECGKQFRPARNYNPPQKYCGRRCAWKATKGPAYNAEISRASSSKRGDVQRGRGEGKVYRKRDGRHEHRIVAEQKIGRPLRKGEVVHHVDGDKLNNDPNNLQVMSQRQHMREHGIGVPGVRPDWQPWTARWGSKKA